MMFMHFPSISSLFRAYFDRISRRCFDLLEAPKRLGVSLEHVVVELVVDLSLVEWELVGVVDLGNGSYHLYRS